MNAKTVSVPGAAAPLTDMAISVELEYRVATPTYMLMQIEVPTLADQRIEEASLKTIGASDFVRSTSESGIGTRSMFRAGGEFSCLYEARVAVSRTVPDLAQLDAVALDGLPEEAIRYLLPSRYCPCTEFEPFVEKRFGRLTGGARVAAMRDWISEHFDYVPGASTPETTALESFVRRQGVCRDYAHVLVSMARASLIPARFVSLYAPRVDPSDFHAVAEVFLDGGWYPVDATGMSEPHEMAKIGVGMDAAETSFLTIFGSAEMVRQSVQVSSGGET